MRVLGLAVAATSMGIAAPALADDRNAPVVLEPSSYWNVDFGEEKCRLARAFGDGENRHLLFIEQGGPSSSFGLIAIGDAFERFRTPSRISVQFGDFEPVTDRTPMLGDTEGGGASIIYSAMAFEERPESDDGGGFEVSGAPLPRLDVEAAHAINSIAVHYGERSVIFDTGNLGEAITVLNECSLDFVESWGLDRAAHETMLRKPKWINPLAVTRRIQETYPSEALRKGESGIVRMRLIVEPNGKISECVLNKATIAESLDSSACKEMRRARFEPALDKDGNPMRSFYTTQIVYRLSR